MCVKNVNEWFLHDNICVLSLSAFKKVFMTWRLAQMKVYFCPIISIDCWLKCQKSSLNLIYAQMIVFVANECNFTQFFAFSHKRIRIFSKWTAKVLFECSSVRPIDHFFWMNQFPKHKLFNRNYWIFRYWETYFLSKWDLNRKFEKSVAVTF